jgi:hypothetical protein
MTLSIFTMLYNHTSTEFQNLFIILKGNPPIASSSSSWQPLNYILSLWIYLLWIFPTIYELLCVVFLTFVSIVAYIRTSFFL